MSEDRALYAHYSEEHGMHGHYSKDEGYHRRVDTPEPPPWREIWHAAAVRARELEDALQKIGKILGAPNDAPEVLRKRQIDAYTVVATHLMQTFKTALATSPDSTVAHFQEWWQEAVQAEATMDQEIGEGAEGT